MNKKYCFGVLISFVFCISLIGCGNVNSGESSEEYSEKNIKTVEKTADKYGALPETSTPSGMSVNAENGSLNKDVIITLTEEDFTGKTNQLLKNGAKQYAIYGRIKVEDVFQQEYAVNYVDKPLNVKLPNSLSKDVIEYYVGVRDNDRDSWRYSRINENENSESNPQTIYSLRASTDNPFFYFKTSKLNYQFALFGLLDNEESRNIAIVTAAIPSVLPAARKLDKDESKSISVSNGKYDEDIKVEVELQGKNLDKLNPSDYIIELTYMTDKGSIIKDLAGTNAVYDIPSKNAGAGNKYLHTVIIKDFTFDSNGKLVFTLNTKEVALADMPLKFSLGVKNAKDNVPALPFGYTKDISVEKFDGVTPLTPTKIVAASSRIKAGDPVTISWEKPEDDTAIDVKYDIYLSNGSDTTLVSENITETTWTYPEVLEPLKIGSYSVTIVAKSAAGSSDPSEPIEFFVVDSQLTIPTFTEIPQGFIIGLNSTLTWPPVEDPLQKGITYNVWLCKDELTEEPTYKEIASNSVEIDTNNLPEGNYKLKLSATNGDTTVESDVFDVVVAYPTIETPRLPEVKEIYNIAEPLIFTWNDVSDPLGGKMNYNIYFAKGEIPEGAEPVDSVASPSYEITQSIEPGVYQLIIEATNGLVSQKSDAYNINLADPALDTPIIDVVSSVYSASESVQITWTALPDKLGKGINYNVWICKDELTDTPTTSVATNAVIFNTSEMATGTYLFKVEAGNGYASSTSDVISFEIAPDLVATLDGSESFIATGYYELCPKFYVYVEAGNKFDHEAFKNSISVTGVESSMTDLNWIDDENRLQIGFKENLVPETEYTISMSTVNDNFDKAITPFEALTFKVVPLIGSGTAESPYSASFLVTEIPTIPSLNRIALIASPTTNISIINEIFTDYEISPVANIIYNNGSENKWENIVAVSNSSSYSADLGEYLWPADAEIDVKFNFSASKDGNTVYFETTPKHYTTEVGDVITLGSGVATDPYLIYTPGQLDNTREYQFDFMEFVMGLEEMFSYATEEEIMAALSHAGENKSNFLQLRNIDLKDYIAEKYPVNGWEPIGDFAISTSGEAPESMMFFIGNYEGNGKSIDNLYIHQGAGSGNSCAGLFGCTMGSISNLTLNNSEIIIANNPSIQMGGSLFGAMMDFSYLMGAMGGGMPSEGTDAMKISNCKINNGKFTVDDCPNVIAVGFLGGEMVGADLSDIEINGNLVLQDSGNALYVSNVLPMIAACNINNLTSNVDIKISNCNVYRYASLTGSYMHMNTTTSHNIENCVINGNANIENVIQLHSAAGFIGVIEGNYSMVPTTTISNCISNMNINIKDCIFEEYNVVISGFIGDSGPYGNLEPVSGSDCCTIMNGCSFNGSINLTGLNSYYSMIHCGGLVAYANQICLNNCSSSGKITYENSSCQYFFLGGLVGTFGMDSYSTNCIMNSCSTTSSAALSIKNITQPSDSYDDYVLCVGKLIGCSYADYYLGGHTLNECSSANAITMTNCDSTSCLYKGGDIGFNFNGEE